MIQIMFNYLYIVLNNMLLRKNIDSTIYNVNQHFLHYILYRDINLTGLSLFQLASINLCNNFNMDPNLTIII